MAVGIKPSPLFTASGVPTEIARHVAVMQIVEVRTGLQFPIEQGTFESMMPIRRSQGCQLRIEEEMDRMRRNNKVNRHNTEVEEMLDRMHGQPRPCAWMGIHMMHGVDGLQ